MPPKKLKGVLVPQPGLLEEAFVPRARNRLQLGARDSTLQVECTRVRVVLAAGDDQDGRGDAVIDLLWVGAPNSPERLDDTRHIGRVVSLNQQVGEAK
jgi:hypothetical protein